MARASGLALKVHFDKVPFLKGVATYARKGAFAGGAIDNRNFFGPSVEFSASVTRNDQMMLFDPQTSGGLLLGVPRARVDDFMRRVVELQQPAWIIGEARDGAGIRVE